ncbi:CBY1-interacting BAR domain-containing protein 1 isoform X2 [Helicoverpa zea]|uniref:CBY1-interacting BAR domain-containing protein 1 isoform X2 n=1 Tax=Helicoverpa zea TaxID=7113 RepID=UPI000B3A60FB|nr:CBY1-interacting BAR domain-containing protein 1 isoform X2 [Helicoverpa armigera]XP_047041788.1 CBY1-interacting BAR domain-containing protein 1 isoform X2 [Helicoverpa zea]
MFRGDNPHSLSYEQQAKFIQDRITNVEKNFGELCVAFGDYTRKTARLRDMGDELIKVIKDYANNEIVNKSLSSGLENLSTTLTAIEEYRNCEVQRLEAKVIGELCQYETICKHAREELKHTMNVREKELARKKVLDKARERQPFNRQQVTYAESELLKASAEMSRTAKGLSEQTEFFERRKLQQLKTLLSDFVMIEMSFHAKAVELLTVAYQQISDINDKADLENFRRKLRSPEKQANPGMTARSSSLASLMNLHSPSNDEDSVNARKLKSPEKYGNSDLARSSSLAALMNNSPTKQEDETSESEETEDESSSEETESR